MTEQGIQRDSAAWLFYVKASFALALMTMLTGIYLLPVVWWVKGYMAMGLLFTVGSSITLAKTVRDDHEARKLINRLSEAKAEKMLRTYDTEA
ncbi:MAG: YiaA/YiaB family inner membrane protein [Bacteroidota bacterium]